MDLPEPCFADRLEASPLSSNAVLHPRKLCLVLLIILVVWGFSKREERYNKGRTMHDGFGD